MKTSHAILMLVLAASLAGCVLKGKQQTAKNTPPPPQPVAKPEPAPAAPLSIPQTQIELPPPQPVNAEALAAAEPPGETVEAPSSAPRNAGGTRRAAGPPPVAPPRTEPAAANAAPATPPAAAPAPAPPLETPRIQEIVPANEQKRLQDLAVARKKETRQLLDQASARRLNHRETGLKKTIESYLKLSDQAEGNGDMRQAADLADRALTLAKDLQSGR
jgi:hypothetical protein